MEMLRKAAGLLDPKNPKRLKIDEVIAKLGKEFAKPSADLGRSELKFMGSQLDGGAPSAMDSGGAVRSSLMGAGVPAAPPPPMPAPAGAPGG